MLFLLPGGMITGNYGLWNAYVLVTMLLYLPQHEGDSFCDLL